jgi:hypothetical protein
MFNYIIKPLRQKYSLFSPNILDFSIVDIIRFIILKSIIIMHII